VQVSSGLHPLVITIFGGATPTSQPVSELARQIMSTMGADITNPKQGFSDLVARRRQEDKAALDYLQTDYLWLDYPDAIVRGNPPYYKDLEALIGGEVHPKDTVIDQALAQMLLELQARLPDTVWYAPLAVGHHADHQIVCSAADRLVQNGAKVYFYEDFPYVVRREDALQQRLAELGTPFEPTLVEMSEMLPARIEAALMYASQVHTNFENGQALTREMETYTAGIRPVETVRLERYWVPRLPKDV